MLISAGEIIRYVQGDQIASLALLLDGQAEVVEIIVEEGTGVIGRSLAELELPKGVIIGAIVRDDQVLIPNGSSEIAAQDRAVVFCLSSHLPILDKLFTGAREACSMDYGVVRKVVGSVLKITAGLMLIPCAYHCFGVSFRYRLLLCGLR